MFTLDGDSSKLALSYRVQKDYPDKAAEAGGNASSCRKRNLFGAVVDFHIAHYEMLVTSAHLSTCFFSHISQRGHKMADDTSDNSEKPTSAAPAAGTEPPKKLPKGVVLGKDGKPCRSCTSFASWASQTKASLKNDPASRNMAEECPPDIETLGRGSWNLLHSIAAQYPENPTRTDQNNVRDFMRLFATLYPCWVCGEGFAKYQSRKPMPTQSRNAFGTWLCDAHNEVNRRLGKPEFDCSKWEERWRTGWKDGRCD
ncbi:hypothetical protein MKZ38_006640 [Zalerion maritima]|uniref:Sulfhydryl oxidase n=1 Tax=Zalerion maritima TaxID=339359 RepID=A0AAD5WWR6_9PEZI|nr:hypothetical protein MKZ38_006640 [Zalerion maritima]